MSTATRLGIADMRADDWGYLAYLCGLYRPQRGKRFRKEQERIRNMQLQLTNVSNPAAFGIEWREGAWTYQLANPRGTATLIWGARNYDSDGWTTEKVAAPERFGMDAPPKTFAEFRRVVRTFIINGWIEPPGQEDQ